MQARDYYLEKVFPELRLPLAEKYPLVSLEECAGLRALGQHPLLMLVALTGTGKSTTLELLQNRLGTDCADVIPSRRELTDWILIPLAQALADEPLAQVPDRVQRFAITRRFREVKSRVAWRLFSPGYTCQTRRGDHYYPRAFGDPMRLPTPSMQLCALADRRIDAESFDTIAPLEQPECGIRPSGWDSGPVLLTARNAGGGG